MGEYNLGLVVSLCSVMVVAIGHGSTLLRRLRKKRRRMMKPNVKPSIVKGTSTRSNSLLPFNLLLRLILIPPLRLPS